MLAELAESHRELQEAHLRMVRTDQLDTTGQLAAGVAHEVKNPLSGLRGAAQLLEQELEDDELREYTRIIMGEADRLRNLLKALLNIPHSPRRKAASSMSITSISPNALTCPFNTIAASLAARSEVVA